MSKKDWQLTGILTVLAIVFFPITIMLIATMLMLLPFAIMYAAYMRNDKQ